MFLLDENILRFLTIQLDEKALKAQQQLSQVAIKQEPAVPLPAPVKHEPLFTDEPEDLGEPKVE